MFGIRTDAFMNQYILTDCADEGAEMNLGVSPGALMVMIVFSLIGFLYFKRGKAVGPTSHMIYGIALMIYPYFISTTLPMLLVGLGIWALTYFLRFG
jgi:hypothetical protein